MYKGLTCDNIPIRVTHFLCITVIDIDIVVSIILNLIRSKGACQEEQKGYQKPMRFDQTSGVEDDRLVDVTLT